MGPVSYTHLKLMLKNINIYAFVNNALTWTNYSGFDPEFSTNNPLQVGKDLSLIHI